MAYPTLKYDTVKEEGFVANIELFRMSISPVIRADLLRDWIAELQEEYDKTVKEM